MFMNSCTIDSRVDYSSTLMVELHESLVYTSNVRTMKTRAIHSCTASSMKDEYRSSASEVNSSCFWVVAARSWTHSSGP